MDEFYWDALNRQGQFDRQVLINALCLLDPPREKDLRLSLAKVQSDLHYAATTIVNKVMEAEEEDDEQYP